MAKSQTLNSRLRAAMSENSADARESFNRFDQIISTLRQLRSELRDIRLERNLTLAEVGVKLGVSSSAVSKLEKRDGDFGVLTLLQYADCLDYEVNIQLESKERVEFAPSDLVSHSDSETDEKNEQRSSGFWGSSDMLTSDLKMISNFVVGACDQTPNIGTVLTAYARKGRCVNFGRLGSQASEEKHAHTAYLLYEFGAIEGDILNFEHANASSNDIPPPSNNTIGTFGIRIGPSDTAAIDQTLVSLKGLQ